MFYQVYFVHMQAGLRYARRLVKAADLSGDGDLLKRFLLFPSDTASLSVGFWVPVTLNDVF